MSNEKLERLKNFCSKSRIKGKSGFLEEKIQRNKVAQGFHTVLYMVRQLPKY